MWWLSGKSIWHQADYLTCGQSLDCTCGRREEPLISTYALRHTCVLSQIHKHKKIRECKAHVQMLICPNTFLIKQSKVASECYSVTSRQGPIERHPRICAGPLVTDSWWWSHDLTHWENSSGSTLTPELYWSFLIQYEDEMAWTIGMRQYYNKESKQYWQSNDRYINFSWYIFLCFPNFIW